MAIAMNELHIYSYEPRRSKTPPLLLKTFKLAESVHSLQFAKDLLLAIFS